MYILLGFSKRKRRRKTGGREIDQTKHNYLLGARTVYSQGTEKSSISNREPPIYVNREIWTKNPYHKNVYGALVYGKTHRENRSTP